MTPIHIQFSRFSAFYSPLISSISGGFLKQEGLDPLHSVGAPGTSRTAGLLEGSLHVVQSAPSQGFGPLERGEQPPVMSFAQVNRKDGFFLAARDAESGFSWQKLAGRRVLVDHGGQPLAMFKFACHKMGLDYGAIDAIDAGGPEEMEQVFRRGEADYIHLQGPAPQQLEHDGAGKIVASVGQAIGPCAFSSLTATRDWLRTDMAQAFMRAYRKARIYVNETSAEEIAEAEAAFFPDTERAVLVKTIADYQALGCWSPEPEISEQAFEVTLDVFLHSGLITKRHAFRDVVAPPPGG